MESQSTHSAEQLETGTTHLVTAIIPALRRPDLTRRCLVSLRAQVVPPAELDIVVVENEARPETILPDPLPSNVHRIELLENYGTTGSINRAVDASDSKYILLLNNDVELTPSFLTYLLAALEQNEAYGFATGKLLSASDRRRLDGAGDALLMGGGAFRLGHGDVDSGQFDSVREVIAGCGAATLFRRSAFIKAGALDEDFFAYVDDVDLGVRIQLLGLRGIYVPDSVAYHIGSATLGDPLHPRVVEWMTRNQVFLLAKNFPAGVLLQNLLRIFIFQILWFGLVLRQGRVFSYIKGLASAFRLFPRIIRKRRDVMRQRRISSAEMMAGLRDSEMQIFAWHKACDKSRRSGLLKLYFCLFRP